MDGGARYDGSSCRKDTVARGREDGVARGDCAGAGRGGRALGSAPDWQPGGSVVRHEDGSSIPIYKVGC